MQYKPISLQKQKPFNPVIIDNELLDEFEIMGISENNISALEEGSRLVKRLIDKNKLFAPLEYEVTRAPDEAFPVHNYTGMCPTNVYEINPAYGSCAISCLYCLVSDGNHRATMQVYTDMAKKVKEELINHEGKNKFFYFSPKTESFAEPLLENGITHSILRVFRDHYTSHPDSTLRLFIATKAGQQHINYQHGGETPLEIIADFAEKVQVNGSIGIMSDELRNWLEPNAPTVEDRLKALKDFQKIGTYAYSVLAQPIIPAYLDDYLDSYLANLKDSGIHNIKPEFFTADMANIALVGSLIHNFDRDLFKEHIELYAKADNQDHVKQRCRTAPERNWCSSALQKIAATSYENGISLSICNWVRKEITGEVLDPITMNSKDKGFRCLGYQENLFR